ncbi:DNA methyltransferase [Deinococcus budaensis]|uniref:DNA methyltransferase n=1 Tax=Deinococcus budaensis TaxID=1665626 RepID=UPI0035F39732
MVSAISQLTPNAAALPFPSMTSPPINRLFYGDNLGVLREHFADASVDLIYLDPPFNSNADYNVIFHDHKGGGSAAQILAFEDTWKWTQDAEEALIRLTAAHGPLSELLHLIVGTLRKNDLSAYLVMMAERLVELHRVLKDTGSLYLHCDPTASHYLKMILDVIFGAKNFRNEIIWKRTSSHGNVSRGYGDVTDSILYYAKSKNFTWNQIYRPYSKEYAEKNFGKRDESGRYYATENLRNPSVRPNLRYDYLASNGVTYKPHPNGWAVSLSVMQEYDRKGLLSL